ncbi:unnamed protein product [Strongylus vulgaris]|uniref:Uncharacterized protein n=1 Tax=Strongylus vulgaris TaxID=40348 RepID=A0A3P7IUV4_STRVU|nr:unnamed protein product [Strongylus vulgaris]
MISADLQTKNLDISNKISSLLKCVTLCYDLSFFVENAAAQKKAVLESSSSSESEDEARPQFITTFGGDDGKGN